MFPLKPNLLDYSLVSVATLVVVNYVFQTPLNLAIPASIGIATGLYLRGRLVLASRTRSKSILHTD